MTAAAPAIRVDGLTITDLGGTNVVDGVSIEVGAQEIHAIVGESGSGKTTVALAMLGHVAPGLRHTSGTAHIGDADMLGADETGRQTLRGARITYAPQEATSALNPRQRVGPTLERMRMKHRERDPAPIAELLELVDLPTTAEFRRRFPHQLSGGQEQRLSIAAALAPQPHIVVFDEPSTGLDAIVQAQLLDTIIRLQDQIGFAAVFITHDLHAAERISRRVTVMRAGRVVETGESAEVFGNPRHLYTRALLDASPAVDRAPPAANSVAVERSLVGTTGTVLDVRTLDASFGRANKAAPVLRGISLRVGRGERMAIVGESGSGKSTLARCIAGLHREWTGSVEIAGEAMEPDVRRRTSAQLQRVQMVFQNPASSLNPARRVLDAVAMTGRMLRGLPKSQARAEAEELLDAVDLSSKFHRRRPNSLSGGQRQRVAIAQALMAHPDLLICDEVTSALDVSVQAEVIDLLQRLSDERGMALLFITHDLSIVPSIAHHTVVLRHGVIVEGGTTAEVFTRRSHPYTRALLAAAARSRSEDPD